MSIFLPHLSQERQRQLRFGVTAIVAYATYLLVYYVTRSTLSLPSAVRIVIAIVAGDVVNFLGSRYWVFRATKEAVPRQGGRFIVVMVTTLLLQTLFFWMGRHFRLLSESLLLLLLPGARVILNYLLHRAFTFVSPSSPRHGGGLY